MSTRTLIRSFAGGEITPEMFGRIDLDKYQTGVAKCRNCVVLPHGPVQNRAGTRMAAIAVGECGLIPFVYSSTQAYVLEFGNLYMRIHTEGGVVLNPDGDPLTLGTPYLAADIFDIHFTQSADVLTLVHPSYPIQELRRSGPTTWYFTAVTTAPANAAPTGLAAAPKGAAGTPLITYEYVVTGVSVLGLEETYASASATCQNNLTVQDKANTVTWTPDAAFVRYNVYKVSNGLAGYIGQADGGTFEDKNITPDVTRTPPEAFTPFDGVGNYPGAVGYSEGRRWFAGSINAPQTLHGTRSGTESNMSRSIPVRDDDSLTLRLLARQANAIRHIVPLGDLLLLTSDAEWTLTAQNSDAITPTTASYKPQTNFGANNAQPIITGSSVLYAQDRGGRVREMLYSWESQGYKSNDVSIMAPHLSDGHTIKQMAHTRSPYSVAWFVRDDGILLGLTYVPEHKVLAWHRHDTDGEVVSVAAIPEGDEDALYLVVKRVVNGATVYFIERMESRLTAPLEDSFFVDCGSTYSGVPATDISGLDYLEGATVSILADGAVHPQRVVQAGAITLENPASKVQVGLPYVSEVEGLPFSFEAPAGGQGVPLNVNKVSLRLNNTSGIQIGPTFDALRELPTRTTEPWGSPPNPVSGVFEVTIDPDWNAPSGVCVRQSQPLPMTLVALALEIEIGG